MSDHPSVLAAVDAVIAREAVYHPGADNSTTREVYAVKSATAVTAAFRERAVHAYDQAGTTESTVEQFRLRLIAEQMDTWADEIEASRFAGPTEEISNE